MATLLVVVTTSVVDVDDVRSKVDQETVVYVPVVTDISVEVFRHFDEREYDVLRPDPR